MGRMKDKKNMRCICGNEIAVKTTVIYCPDCGKKMEEGGIRFFDHLKFINIHASQKSQELQYVFTLSLDGIFINGCTFKPRTGSLKMPTAMAYGHKYRMVKLSGSFAIAARKRLYDELAKLGLPLRDIGETEEAA